MEDNKLYTIIKNISNIQMSEYGYQNDDIPTKSKGRTFIPFHLGYDAFEVKYLSNLVILKYNSVSHEYNMYESMEDNMKKGMEYIKKQYRDLYNEELKVELKRVVKDCQFVGLNRKIDIVIGYYELEGVECERGDEDEVVDIFNPWT